VNTLFPSYEQSEKGDVRPVLNIISPYAIPSRGLPGKLCHSMPPLTKPNPSLTSPVLRREVAYERGQCWDFPILPHISVQYSTTYKAPSKIHRATYASQQFDIPDRSLAISQARRAAICLHCCKFTLSSHDRSSRPRLQSLGLTYYSHSVLF